MKKPKQIQHSILIVSGSEKFDTQIRKILPPEEFSTVETRNNAASARRNVMERYYDLVVINGPLPDETGIGFAIDAAGQGTCSFLVVVPADVYEDVLERVTKYGILVVPKPATLTRIRQAIRFLSAQQERLRELRLQLEAAEEKMEELRVVAKAKCLLIEKRHMSEEEAHRWIGKQAMDRGVTRRRMAQEIVEDLEG